MKKTGGILCAFLCTVLALTGCSGGGSPTNPVSTAAPVTARAINVARLAAGSWASQGPGITLHGQVTIPAQQSPEVGAVRAIAPYAPNPDVVYIGTVNGGVWRTQNATDPSGPTWTPLTDQQSSLSIGDLQFDSADPTGQSLVAGLGCFSAFRRTQANGSGLMRGLGGPLDGLLRTTDGGQTWQPLGKTALGGCNIAALAVRGPLLLIAANQAGANPGLHRSTDGGATFARIAPGAGLPAGAVQAVVADEANPGRYYAAVISSGIYRTDDDGATWTSVTTPTLAPFFDGSTDNVKISVHNSAGNNVVWVGVIRGGSAEGFFRSANAGGTWSALGVPTTVESGITIGMITETTNGSGLVHFSMAADPNNPDLLYTGGDAQASGDGNVLPTPVWPNSIGSTEYTGRLFRADATQPAGSRWTPLTDNYARAPGGPPTGPHADSRCITFDALGNLLESNDGGIYKRTLPASPTGTWSSLIGTGSLAVTEIHSLAFDPVSRVLMAGTQDVGVPEQEGSGQSTWRSVLQDDGGNVAVDGSLPGHSIRYCSSQYLGNFRRRLVDAANNVLATETPGLLVDGSGGASIFTYDPALQFYNPLRLNAVDPSRLLIATSTLYESGDRGDHLQVLGALGAPTGGNTYGSPVVYGGRRGGRANPDLVYVGAGASLFQRTAAGQPLTRLASYPGGDVAAIAVHPDDWGQAVVLDSSHAYLTTDAGLTWNDVTGNLPLAGLQTVAIVPADTGPYAIVVGGGYGVYAALSGSPTGWFQVGAGLPRAIAMDLQVVTPDGMLLVGTLGRGAWMLDNLLAPATGP